MIKIVLASDNAGKLQEIESLLNHLPIKLLPQSAFHVPPVAETGLSFVENALIKARHAATYSQLPALADDSGLAVNALGGAPGIYSARYAGPKANAQDNIEKLLEAIHSVPAEERTACFHCAIVFVRHAQDPIPIICQAQWEGSILTEPRGTGGFGYDPIFLLHDLNCSAAELEPAQKNVLSHRAKALHLLVQALKQLYPHITPSSI